MKWVWEGRKAFQSKRKAQVRGSHGAVWSGVTTSWLDDFTTLGHNFLFYFKKEEYLGQHSSPTHTALTSPNLFFLSSSVSLCLCQSISLCTSLSLSFCFSLSSCVFGLSLCPSFFVSVSFCFCLSDLFSLSLPQVTHTRAV